MWQFYTSFSSLFLELKDHCKHVLNSPRYISGFQMLLSCRSIVIVRSQSFSRFRVMITLYEMINEPRLKTGPYFTCFLLFFLSSKSTMKKVYYQMVILQSINAGFRTAILVFTWFIL